MASSDGEVGAPRGAQRWRGILQLAVVVAVIAAGIFFARAPTREYRELAPGLSRGVVEAVAPVVEPLATSAAHQVRLTGMVTTLGNVAIVPEVSGEVVWVSENFRNGAAFTSGETLARIDTTRYDIALANARSGLADAHGRLAEKRAEAASAAAFDSAYPSATPPAGQPSAAAVLRAWLGRAGTIERAEAMVEVARRRIELAEIDLDKTRIRLPFDGYVMGTRISAGQVVQRYETNMGEAFPHHHLRVRAQVSAFDLASLQPVIGREATAVADGVTYATRVERVSSVVDVDTRMASMYLRILDQESADVLPPPGTFVDVTVTGPPHEGVFVLPESAMQIGGSVWVVDGGRLRPSTPTSLGFTRDGWIVRAFDVREGVVVGAVPGAREGLGVNAVAATHGAPATGSQPR